MTELVDVLIVGAGPAGSAAALGCARRGIEKVVVIDKSNFPRTKVCASGLSPRAQKFLQSKGLWDRIGAEAYSICGIRLVSPSGCSAHFDGSGPASVLARQRLDRILIEEAVAAGAEFRPGTRAASLLYDGARVVGVRTDSEEITARWVVNAGGAKVRLGHIPGGRVLLHTCMAWFEGLDFTPNVVEMIFDPAIAPHYTWLFPESPTRVNIGFCIDANRRDSSVREIFAGLLERHFSDRLLGAEQIGRWRSHPIAASVDVDLAPPVGLLPVGEAAALVNAGTGEGIAYGLESGELAALMIERGLRGSYDASEVTREYLAACHRRFTVGLRGGEIFRLHGSRVLNAVTHFGNRWMMRRAANQAMRALTG